MHSKNKGKRGELELRDVLRSLFPGVSAEEIKRGQQHKGGPDSPDVTFPGVHFECKRTERFNLYDAMEQAIGDAGDNVPVVAHRRNREDWVFVVRAKDFRNLVKRVKDVLE